MNENQKPTEGIMDKFLKSGKDKRALTKVEFDDLLLETAVPCSWSFYQFDVPQFKILSHSSFSRAPSSWAKVY